MFQINEESEYKPSPPRGGVTITNHGHSNSAYNGANNYVIINRGVGSKYSKKSGNNKYIREPDIPHPPAEQDNATIIVEEDMLCSQPGIHLPHIPKIQNNMDTIVTNNGMVNSMVINPNSGFHNNTKSLYYGRMPNEPPAMMKSQVYSCRGGGNVIIQQRRELARECSPEYYIKGKI